MSTAVTDAPAGADAPTTATGRWRFGLATLVVGLAVALVAGFAVAMVVLRPADPPADDSAEAGFARDMITHHLQAVEMSMIAYDRATLPGVRQLGYDIATGQQGQIGMMHQWLRDWGLPPTGPEPPMAWMPGGEAMAGAPMPGMATADQLRALREAEGPEVDRLFLELMTAHHLGGIHMVDGVLDLTDHPDVNWLAGLMKEGQQREMQVLGDLRTQLDGTG
jgi:uncharacterized protein (DUF305 family)